MSIADFDELNVQWISEMELPVAEKLMRVQMITEFEERIEKIFKKEKETTENGINTALAITLLTVPLILEWRSVCDKYYESYVSLVSRSGKTGFPSAEEWKKQHSVDFARWVQETTTENLNTDYVFSIDRIRDIARTETNAICDLATLDGFYREGYTKKKWSSFHDGKTRHSHKAADGQVQPLSKPFTVGDSLLMFPHDSSLGASASEIVNCRCIMLPVK